MTDKRITVRETARVLRKHVAEITLACKRTAQDVQGWRVLAEVSNAGDWRGAGRVSPGTLSLMAHERRGRACYFTPSRRMTQAEVRYQIAEWIEIEEWIEEPYQTEEDHEQTN